MKFLGAVNSARSYLSKHKGAAVAVAGGSLVAASGLLVASRLKKKRRAKNRRARKASNRRKATQRIRRTPRTAGKRKDRSTKRIRYTKNGQPYIILRSGKARFLKKKSARISHKRRGGKY
jgi:hypothetical protein